MFLLNSCLSLFSATWFPRLPFSRSYGYILPSSLTMLLPSALGFSPHPPVSVYGPSSLTMLLPSALGFSPHPPVSVYGTGTVQTIAAFLGTKLTCFPTFISVHITPLDYEADLPASLLLRLYRSFLSRLTLTSCVPTVLLYCSAGI